MNINKPVFTTALLLLLSGLASADVILTASASPISVPVGSDTSVTVTLSDGATSNSVAGFQFDLDFNPVVLQATSITEDGYFANNGLIGLTTADINNTAGTITLISDAAGTPEDPGTGDPLVTVAFSAAAPGSSPIVLANVIISGPQLNKISATEANTTVNVTGSAPEPYSLSLAGIGLALMVLAKRCYLPSKRKVNQEDLG
jgi:hypothetical protein